MTSSARCTRCGASVLKVQDFVIALLDPSPVSLVGELLATLEGRYSYDITAWGEARWRGPFEIGKHPVGTADRPVYVTHVCRQPVPVAWQGVGPRGRVRAPAPEKPPF